MIYISTGCSHYNQLNECLNEIKEWGFKQIELTGGLQRTENLSSKLLDQKEKYGLSFQCHNYFPPPQKSFVLNLSSQNNILKRSRSLISQSLEISHNLGSSRYGIHAGFRINPKTQNLGKVFDNSDLIPLNIAEQRMVEQVEEITLASNDKDIELYIENNVYSHANKERFKDHNPFLLCSFSDYERISKLSDNINVLLDIGHLKVSCNSLNLNYEEELAKFLKITDYIHISDNDGLSDQNLELAKDSTSFSILNNLKHDFKPKCLTIEVYTGKNSVKKTANTLEALL